MTAEWTEEQKKVIDHRGRSLLVSAAAGSGKTAVLVERIVRMVTDPDHPVDIDRLLVVTFTRAAAGEMRGRLQDALEKKLAAENMERMGITDLARILQLRHSELFSADQSGSRLPHRKRRRTEAAPRGCDGQDARGRIQRGR